MNQLKYEPGFRNRVDFYCAAIEIPLKMHKENEGIDSICHFKPKRIIEVWR